MTTSTHIDRARRPGGRVAVALLVVAMTAAGCSSAKPSDQSPIAGMTAAEYRYGVAPTPGSTVTYQPGVVIPGGGAASVRSVSADGMTWTLDASAAHVRDLRPGSILFVTNRGAGRVLGIRHRGHDVAVTLGPADITDVVRDADIHYAKPIDPRSIIFRAGPNVPGTVVPLFTTKPSSPSPDAPGSVPSTTTTTSSSTTAPTQGTTPTSTGPGPSTTQAHLRAPQDVAPAAGGDRPLWVAGAERPALSALERVHGSGGRPAPSPLPSGPLPLPTPNPPQVPITGLSMTPLAASYGFGVQVAYDKAGVKVFGQAVLYVSHPTLGFDLKIAHGKLQRAKAVLHGAAGIRLQFQAGSVNGISGNLHEIAQLPVDISIPLAGPALPLALTLHQELLINSAFSAKNSTLRFDGDYGFDGSIGFGYENGHFGAEAPAGFHVRKSLLQSIDGHSVGVNGLVIAYQLKAIVGIGGWGFAVGPYFSLTASSAVANGSDLGIVKCRGATFDLTLGYGVGYSIPAPVTKAINFFLRALNMGQIRSSGGTPPILQPLIHKQGYAPNLALCAGAV